MKKSFILTTLFLISGTLFLFPLEIYAQNVGIGTPSPAFRLDVGGRMRVKTGTLNNVSTSSGVWFEDYRDGTNRVFFGMQDSIRAGFYGSGTNGVGWDFNFNATNGNVGLMSGLLGIGTLTPVYDIHISRVDPSIGFFDVDDNFYSGSIVGDSTDLLINAYRKSSVGTNTAGNLILQVTSTGFPSFQAGRVGIGTYTPDVKLQVAGGTDVNGVSGGYLQLGNSTGLNIGFDNDEVQARNDGAVTKLTLQANGGGLQIGAGTTAINFTAAGELNRGTASTANLLPLAYGRISSSGTILSGTGNFTVARISTGYYRIRIPSESNMFLNEEVYTMLFTANGTSEFDSGPMMITSVITSDNLIDVRTSKPYLYWVNSSCSSDCGPFSYITGFKFHDEVDKQFSFLIYKQ